MEEAPSLPLQGLPSTRARQSQESRGRNAAASRVPAPPQRGRAEDGSPAQQASGACGALCLTCPVRQRPQEIEGRPLDPHAAQQERAEVAPRVTGWPC